MHFEVYHERRGLQAKVAGKGQLAATLREVRSQFLRPELVFVIRVGNDGSKHRLGAETLAQLLR